MAYQPYTERIIDFLGCKCEVFQNAHTGDVIIDAFKRDQLVGKQQGFTPVLIVASDTLLDALEIFLEDMDVSDSEQDKVTLHQQIMHKATSVNVEQLLNNRLDEYKKDAHGYGYRGCFH